MSMTSESGIATKGSIGHFWFILDWPEHIDGTYGNWPGASSTTFVAMQFLQRSLSFEALMYGFVVLMMIPLTTKIFPTRELLIYLILMGF